MSIVTKHFLASSSEKQEQFKNGYVDVFLISEEINLVDCQLCGPLSKQIGADVYWYTFGNKAIVCVNKDNVDSAIKAGKQIIIENFTNISSKYVNRSILPVLDDYSIIATFQTDDVDGLTNWCNSIDDNLLVKTNEKGEKCVLTTEPLEYTCKVKAKYKKHPFPTILNFDFLKI